MNKSAFICILLIILSLATSNVSAKAIPIPLGSSGRHEIELELDPYYSAFDYIVSLTDDSIPRMSQTTEDAIYRYLLHGLFHPRMILTEISINPLPLGGAMLEKYARTFYYEKAYIGKTNYVKTLTAGFPEPWALSLFWGGVVNFYNPEGVEHVTTGKGYSGFLISIGNYHLANNFLFADNWMELETKVKGSEITPERKMSWSFRIGTKLHSHRNIADIFYLSIKRDRADFVDGVKFQFFDLFIRNSEIEFRADMSYKLDFTRLLILGGKKWPLKKGKYIISLGLGLERHYSKAYTGILNQYNTAGWGFLFRPNFLW